MTEAELPVLPETQAPWPARDTLRITRVRAIVTAPEGPPLVVVRIDTNEPGLYGLGCATFTQRFTAVVATIEQHVAPMLIGRHPADIEDIFRMVHFSSYWRNGPVTNNALAGVDLALWDIAGKRAGMPVYELLGGRVRDAPPSVTCTRAGRPWRRRWTRPGSSWRPATGTSGSRSGSRAWARTAPPGSAAAIRGSRTRTAGTSSTTCGPLRRSSPPPARQLGEEVELLHDVHSRLTPKQVVLLARALEPYRLFFLEDVDRAGGVRPAAADPRRVAGADRGR